MFNVVIDYPTRDEERRILAETTTGDEPAVSQGRDGRAISRRARALVRDLPAADNVVDYALRLVRATRPADETAPRRRARVGASGAPARAPARRCCSAPRRRRSSTAAACRRPTTCAPSRCPVLRHRMLLNFQAEADGVEPDQVIGRLLEAIACRRPVSVTRCRSSSVVAAIDDLELVARLIVEGLRTGPAPQPVSRLQRGVQPVPRRTAPATI